MNRVTGIVFVCLCVCVCACARVCTSPCLPLWLACRVTSTVTVPRPGSGSGPGHWSALKCRCFPVSQVDFITPSSSCGFQLILPDFSRFEPTASTGLEPGANKSKQSTLPRPPRCSVPPLLPAVRVQCIYDGMKCVCDGSSLPPVLLQGSS